MKDNNELIVLEEVKFPATEDELQAFSDKHKEVAALDPEVGIKDKGYLTIRSEHIKAVTYRTSIEKSRKRIVDPAFKYMKAANQMAKDLTAITSDAEQKLFAERQKVEHFEKEKEQRRIREEEARVNAINEKIMELKAIPGESIGKSKETLVSIYGAVKIPDEEDYQGRLDEAHAAYTSTMNKLESMISQAGLAESAAKREEEEKARRAKEDEEREAEQAKEREAFEEEKRAFRAEQENANREAMARQEAINMEEANRRADELERKQREEAEAAKEAHEKLLAELEEQRLADVKHHAEQFEKHKEEAAKVLYDLITIEKTPIDELIDDIINGVVPHIKWEVVI